MNAWIDTYRLWLDHTAAPVCVFLITLFIGYLVRAIVLRRLEAMAAKTVSQVDDMVIRAIRLPMLIWFLMLGVHLAVQTSHLPPHYQSFAAKTMLSLGILSVTMVLSNLAANLTRVYAVKMTGGMPVSSLTNNIARIIVLAIGIMIILNTLGISIAPILATLGVGGLAVALALQDTLSNLFAGFHITAAKQVRVGDYIRLETGQEGYVQDISWRTTKIRTLPDIVVLIPNTKLSQSIITNFHMPTKEITVAVDVSVHYKSDLAHVEAVTTAVAREVMATVPGGVPSFEPSVRFVSLGDFAVNAKVSLRVAEFADQFLVKHEFLKRLLVCYAREGIVIPYPVQAVNHTQES
jgi:small-conductance mechanosensitive channel